MPLWRGCCTQDPILALISDRLGTYYGLKGSLSSSSNHSRLCIPIRTRCSLCLALKINSWCMCIADALVVSLPPVASISCCLCFGCLLLLLLWLHLLLRMSWFLQLHRLHLLVLNVQGVVVAVVVVAASFALVALLLLGFLCCLCRLFCSSCICKGANVANCFTCY